MSEPIDPLAGWYRRVNYRKVIGATPTPSRGLWAMLLCGWKTGHDWYLYSQTDHFNTSYCRNCGALHHEQRKL